MTEELTHTEQLRSLAKCAGELVQTMRGPAKDGNPTYREVDQLRELVALHLLRLSERIDSIEAHFEAIREKRRDL